MLDENLSIIYAEDDDVDFRDFTRALRSHDIQNKVHRAVNGEEVLELLKSADIKKPLVILLDINMPRMDGLELLKVLRSSAEHRTLTVIMLTTSDHTHDVYHAHSLNVAGYLSKPFSIEKFKQVIDTAPHL